MKTLIYRPEIDGLRAVAVLSVILFHAGVSALQGGFIGVDIFYVISGFLITKIIVTALSKDHFSFPAFYLRRIKRLLPAAIVMILLTMLFGFFILTPEQYELLAKSAIYSNLFMANVWFMNTSGYFDQSTLVSPLAHMWSLSVEEQFYLIFPPTLYLAHYVRGINGITFIVCIITCVSLIASIMLSGSYPNFSFYMLATRAWELGLGALVVLLPAGRLVDRGLLTSALGLVFILTSLIFIDHNDVFPGYMALMPTIGACLIIIGLTKFNNLIGKVLSTAPFLIIGKSSYSAYLWHWPIIVYYRIYIGDRDFGALEVIMLIFTSFCAGYLSWKLVEEPFRQAKSSKGKIIFTSSFVTGLTILVSLIVYQQQGFPGRINSQLVNVTSHSLMWEWKCTEKVKLFDEIDEEYCVVGSSWNTAIRRGMIWGDSHSEHWAQLLHKVAIDSQLSLVIAPTKCPPYLDVEHVSSHYPKFPEFTDSCTKRNRVALKWLLDNPDIKIVVLAAAWSGHSRMLYTEKFQENKVNTPLEERSSKTGAMLSFFPLDDLVSKLNQKKVIILGDVPRPNSSLNDCLFAASGALLREKCEKDGFMSLDAGTISKWHRDSNDVLRNVANNHPHASAIIPSDYLCDHQYCKTFINGELIYMDSNHLRRNLQDPTVEILSMELGLSKHFKN